MFIARATRRPAGDRGVTPPDATSMPGGSLSPPAAARPYPGVAAPGSLWAAPSMGGTPLPTPRRRLAVADLSADLSHVSIFTGPAAARALDAADARAMAVGSAVVLRDRAALGDRRLLAHELAPHDPAAARPRGRAPSRNQGTRPNGRQRQGHLDAPTAAGGPGGGLLGSPWTAACGTAPRNHRPTGTTGIAADPGARS